MVRLTHSQPINNQILEISVRYSFRRDAGDFVSQEHSRSCAKERNLLFKCQTQ
jgi:hypothetical protein